VTYLDDLSRALAAHGIRGRTRRRILAEFDDHLRSDPGAEERLGAAQDIANTFAAELGAQASRRAAVGAFAALGVAGAAYAASFVSLQLAGQPHDLFEPLLGALAFAALIVCPQVAFVTGTLALVRAIRLRGQRVLPTNELVAIRRRTTVALGFGLATMAALALFAHEFRAELAGWWLALTYGSTAAASLLLALALVPTVRAAHMRPEIAGDAGDVFDDIGLVRYRAEPWRFARRVAVAVGLVVWLAAAVQGDPLDGLLNGIAEGIACLGAYAVLGRYIALRR
jgi:hypothetical protein